MDAELLMDKRSTYYFIELVDCYFGLIDPDRADILEH